MKSLAPSGSEINKIEFIANAGMQIYWFSSSHVHVRILTLLMSAEKPGLEYLYCSPNCGCKNPQIKAKSQHFNVITVLLQHKNTQSCHCQNTEQLHSMST